MGQDGSPSPHQQPEPVRHLCCDGVLWSQWRSAGRYGLIWRTDLVSVRLFCEVRSSRLGEKKKRHQLSLSSSDKNPQQHVPLQEYSENLKDISRFLSSAGVSADKVIFITPPPLHEPAWEKECILKGKPDVFFCYPSSAVLIRNSSSFFQDVLSIGITPLRVSTLRLASRQPVRAARRSWISGRSCRKTDKWVDDSDLFLQKQVSRFLNSNPPFCRITPFTCPTGCICQRGGTSSWLSSCGVY